MRFEYDARRSYIAPHHDGWLEDQCDAELDLFKSQTTTISFIL